MSPSRCVVFLGDWVDALVGSFLNRVTRYHRRQSIIASFRKGACVSHVCSHHIGFRLGKIYASMPFTCKDFEAKHRLSWQAAFFVHTMEGSYVASLHEAIESRATLIIEFVESGHDAEGDASRSSALFQEVRNVATNRNCIKDFQSRSSRCARPMADTVRQKCNESLLPVT